MTSFKQELSYTQEVQELFIQELYYHLKAFNETNTIFATTFKLKGWEEI